MNSFGRITIYEYPGYVDAFVLTMTCLMVGTGAVGNRFKWSTLTADEAMKGFEEMWELVNRTKKKDIMGKV